MKYFISTDPFGLESDLDTNRQGNGLSSIQNHLQSYGNRKELKNINRCEDIAIRKNHIDNSVQDFFRIIQNNYWLSDLSSHELPLEKKTFLFSIILTITTEFTYLFRFRSASFV